MEAVRRKSSVGLSDRKSAVTKYVGYTCIVDIGAKPKKAWFDFWLTLHSVLPVGFDLSRRYLPKPCHTRLKQLVFPCR
jgi:hypothetical protein